MPDFVLDYALFERAARRNNYPLDHGSLMFFGVRGALPLDVSGTPFGNGHPMRVTDPDHLLMRCTLGQVRSSDQTLAVFPGSTVPTLKYVKAAIAKGGASFYCWLKPGVMPPGITMEDAVTTFGAIATGDPVNLEIDVIARYCERLLSYTKS